VIGGAVAAVQTKTPTTAAPTGQPTTNQPTTQPAEEPTTLDPTQEPTTLEPTRSPTRVSQRQTCEFDVAKYSCPKGVIDVVYASLGRDEKSFDSESFDFALCSVDRSVCGASQPVTERVAQRCNNHKSCSVYVSKEELGLDRETPRP
jgi:hypothetical protein